MISVEVDKWLRSNKWKASNQKYGRDIFIGPLFYFNFLEGYRNIIVYDI